MKTIKHKYQILVISLIAGLLLNLVSAVNFVSALTYQNSVDVEFTINPSLSINLSANDLIINDLTPGSSSDSNIITVDVATNAGYGYYMSATAGASTTDTNLTHSTNTSNVFTNLATNATTLSDFPDNYWGYSYSTDNGSTWISGSQGDTATGYNGLPLDNDDSGATGVILASTDSLTNAGSVKFKIGAKASATQASGTYTNTVNFYAVANPEPTLAPVSCNPGKICYNVNSLTTTEGTMGEQGKDNSNADIVDGATVTLLASNFSRTGYGFAGWSDTYDYSGNLYGPHETITAPTGTTTNGLSLYAIWVRSAGSMQSDAASTCSRLTAATPSTPKTLNSVSALTDQRDGDTYAIAKLADGKCWMIENLRLDNTADHNSDGVLAQGYGTSSTYGNFGGLAEPESSTFRSVTTANSLYYSGTQSGTASINIGTSDAPGYRMPRYNNANTSTRASSPDNNNSAMYSYGNYYNWPAAIANLIYNDTDNQSTTGTSLCPKGWHLPIGGRKPNVAISDFWKMARAVIGTDPANFNNGDDNFYYTSLYTSEGYDASDKMRAYPNNILYSGQIYNSSSPAGRGLYSYYWSSTASGSSYSYNQYLDRSYVNPGTATSDKPRGYSVRCVVDS
ncbi:hypothetical protein IJG22_03865 [Candidatus Saccharibacteria bacterium]|nr:hypothetical protein [Candidatus Saccharibacteria bacterium]